MLNTSARQASAAIAVACSTGVPALRPVAGSITWWRSMPSAGRPAPARPRRGGDAAVGDGDVRDRLVVGRVADRDHPRVAGAGGRTGDAQVATDVDAHARGTERAQLVGDQVGGEALADPTGIEAGAGRQRDGAVVGVDVDVGGTAVAADGRGRGHRPVQRRERLAVADAPRPRRAGAGRSDRR